MPLAASAPLPSSSWPQQQSPPPRSTPAPACCLPPPQPLSPLRPASEAAAAAPPLSMPWLSGLGCVCLIVAWIVRCPICVAADPSIKSARSLAVTDEMVCGCWWGRLDPARIKNLQATSTPPKRSPRQDEQTNTQATGSSCFGLCDLWHPRWLVWGQGRCAAATPPARLSR